MDEQWQTLLPSFDKYSYFAGVTAAFAEIVAAGIKPLALSPPYSPTECAVMREPSQRLAQAHGVTQWVEDELLRTPLFPESITRGKQVILLAADETVLGAYWKLKRQRAHALATGTLAAIEKELGQEFGILLGYRPEYIARRLGGDGG